MGGGSSRPTNRPPELNRSEAEIVRLMLPIYYTSESITDAELEMAKKAWAVIMNNTAPEFLRLKQSPDFPHATCIKYFYSKFYERFFDIHPLARDLFKDVNQQGHFLVKLISLSLSEKDDPVKYEATLVKLVEIHNERGVKAIEYGLVGDVLFWSISRCIGQEMYTEEVHQAFIKIMSRMLRTMVPESVKFEMQNNSAQCARVRNYFAGESALQN